MKSLIKTSVLALSLSIVFTITSKAQDTPSESPNKSGVILSIGADAGIPIGSFKDRYDWNLGGSIQADFPVVEEKLYVTVNAGYTNFFAKDDLAANTTDLQLIPLKAGLKYFPADNFYLQGEAGTSLVVNKEDILANKSATFVYAPQIGYQFQLGGENYIDAGVRFEGNSKLTDNGSSNNFLGLRVAYAFGL